MQAPNYALSTSPKQLVGEAFLKFQLAPQVPAMFSARAVQEATVVPTPRITAMPNMPACMLGLINRRSRVVWVANLIRLLGLPIPERSSQQYSLITIQVANAPLALKVETIDGIVHIPPEAIQPPPNHANPVVLPYLKGSAIYQGESILILDAEAILQSSALQHA
ncbi:MAG: chemotaxis protein CheW [Cyanobacteria bacterium P01_A01_bin.114]